MDTKTINMERTLSDISLSSTSPPASLFDSSPTQSTVALRKTTNSGTPPFSSVFSFINESKQQNKQVQEQSHSDPVPTSLIDDLLFNIKSVSSTSSSSRSSTSNDTEDPSPSLLSSSFKHHYQQQQEQEQTTSFSSSKMKKPLLLPSSSITTTTTKKKTSTSSPSISSSVNTTIKKASPSDNNNNNNNNNNNSLVLSSSSPFFINKKSSPLLTTAVHSFSSSSSPSPSSKFHSPSPMSYSSLLQEQQKNHHHNKTPEMNGLIEETAWKKIQMEKQFQKDKIHQVYKEKWNILNDIQQVKNSIEDHEKEKKRILENDHEIEEYGDDNDDDDYIKLEKLDHDIKEMDQRLVTLMKKLLHELTNHPLRVTWHDLLYYIKKEETCANNVVLSCQLNKKERASQLHRYHSDIDKNHQQQLLEIHNVKEEINVMKKKNNDELESWENSDTEFNQKITEITQEETTQKKELCSKVNALDEEIDALLIQLEGLKQQKQTHLNEIQQLDHQIEQKTATFYPEKDKLTKAKKEIDSRKHSLDQQLMDVDQQYKQMREKINKQQEKYDHQTKELNEIDKTIEKATDQSQLNQLEVEFISTILNEIVIDRDHLISQKLQSQLQMKIEIKDYEYHLLQQQQACDQAHQQLNDHLSFIEQLSSKKNTLLRQKEWCLQMTMKKKRNNSNNILDHHHQLSSSSLSSNNRLVSKLEKEMEQLQQLMDQGQEKQHKYQMVLDNQLYQLEEMNKTISRLHRQQKHEQQQITETMKDVLKLIEDKLSQYTNKKEAKLLIDNEMKNIQIWKQYFDIENQDNNIN